MDKLPNFDPAWLLNPSDKDIPYYFKAPPSVKNAVGLKREQIITISAKNGQNIDWLKENLLRSVIEGGLNLESTIVSNARHFEALQKSYASLDDVLHSMVNGITTDFVAMDIRRSLHYLGEITGDVGVDDLLENIFSKFCIGK